jgi:type II secretory pathway component PulK
MTLTRGAALLTILTLTGIAAVMLRTQTASAAWRVQQLQQRQMALRHELWTAQAELADVAGPAHLRQRVLQMQLAVKPPEPQQDGDVVAEANRRNPSSAEP